MIVVREVYVAQIINNWDPIDLVPHSPEDEYEVEIKLILQLLDKSRNIPALAEGIKNIFTRRFGKDVFTKSYDECTIIAKQLLEHLIEE